MKLSRMRILTNFPISSAAGISPPRLKREKAPEGTSGPLLREIFLRNLNRLKARAKAKAGHLNPVLLPSHRVWAAEANTNSEAANLAHVITDDLDPGVTPPSPPRPAYMSSRKDFQKEPDRVLPMTVAPADQGHCSASSDTIIPPKKNVKPPRGPLGLCRQKARVYGRLPLLLLLSPEPCSLPPSRYEFSHATKTKVSMESIKPKGASTKVVATHEGVVQRSTQMSSRRDDKIGIEEKEFTPKIVCGLPCASKEREQELNYTLDILSGIGVRRVEEEKPRRKPRIRSKIL